MFKRASVSVLLGLLVSGLMTPVVAGGASVGRVEHFASVLAVSMSETFPVASLMRVDCSFSQLVTHRDGSATETMKCQLSDEPVMIPEFQGAAPGRAFVHVGEPCRWISDYYFYAEGIEVYAETIRYTVTPSGQVHAKATYPAEPLVCD